ncbi:MAG: hypothetical protein ACPGWS_00740 [Solirubrobacterales bacterium]
MGNRSSLRLLVTLTCAVLIGVFVSGCGGDNGDENAKTGEGATAGATGNEAGGFAVEAGKQRDPKDVERESEFTSEPPPVQVLNGNETGYHVNKPTVVIARSNKELKAMEKKHFDNGVERQEIAPVDFKTRQVVGLFLPESQRGALVAVSDVSQNGEEIKIKATLLLPGKGCESRGPRPRPFHWVETRTLKGDPTIEIEKQTSSPC